MKPLDPANVTDTPRTPLTSSPRPPPIYSGLVVVLINRGCFSACEGFTRALQTLGRVRVVGTASGGGIGIAGLIELPSAALSSMSWSVFWLPDGRWIERHGILPDAFVINRSCDRVDGRDRVLERAMRELEEGRAQ